MKRYISIDAETNGLRGKAFSIAGVAIENNVEISRFVGRCPIDGKVNQWVTENVLPEMEDIKENYSSYESLLKAFMLWHGEFQQWNSWDNKEGFQTMWHMGHIVEVQLFSDAFDMGIIGEFDSPYCPIELASILQRRGLQIDSVDEYIKDKNLEKPECVGGTHNPLYDALVASTVYEHLCS